MSVVEHELKRHRTLADDVAKRKREGIATQLMYGITVVLLVACTLW